MTAPGRLPPVEAIEIERFQRAASSCREVGRDRTAVATVSNGAGAVSEANSFELFRMIASRGRSTAASISFSFRICACDGAEHASEVAYLCLTANVRASRKYWASAVV